MCAMVLFGKVLEIMITLSMTKQECQHPTLKHVNALWHCDGFMDLAQHCFRPSHCPNQWWYIVDMTIRYKFQWNFNKSTILFQPRKYFWKWNLQNFSNFGEISICLSIHLRDQNSVNIIYDIHSLCSHFRDDIVKKDPVFPSDQIMAYQIWTSVGWALLMRQTRWPDWWHQIWQGEHYWYEKWLPAVGA